MKHSIEVKGLKKSYGKIEAVKGINFYVEQGKLFAFLGPNGAGVLRSEERRVGKECRSRWSPYH